ERAKVCWSAAHRTHCREPRATCAGSRDDCGLKRDSSSICRPGVWLSSGSLTNDLVQPSFTDDPHVGDVPTRPAALPELRDPRDVLAGAGLAVLGHARREHRHVARELEGHFIEVALHAALPGGEALGHRAL